MVNKRTFVNPLMQAPLLNVVLCLAAGVVLSGMGKVAPSLAGWLVLAAVALALTVGGCLCAFRLQQRAKRKGLLAFIRFQRRSTPLLYVMPALLLLSVGGMLGTLRISEVKTAWPSGDAVWEGQAVHIVKVDSADVQLDVLLQNARWKGKKVRLKVYGGASLHLVEGNLLSFSAHIDVPRSRGNPGEFDYATYLLHQGVSGAAWCEAKNLKLQRGADTSENWLQAWRMQMLHLRCSMQMQYATQLDSTLLQVVSALTLGEKSALTADSRHLFSDTGTSHVLALSGLHLGILFALFNLLVWRWVGHRWMKRLLGVAGFVGLWSFVMLCGESGSLVRSAAMLSVMLLMRLFNSPTPPMHHLSVAALVMLVADPFTLYDVGFQLSFSAVFAILFFSKACWLMLTPKEQCVYWMKYPPMRERYLNHWTWMKHRFSFECRKFAWWCRQIVLSCLLVSVVAQMGTLPLVIFYFHVFTPYAALASLVVLPLVWATLLLAVFFFLLPFLQGLWAALLQAVVGVMLHVLEQISSWPGASCQVYESGWVLLVLTASVVLLACGWVRCSKRLRAFGLLGMLVGASWCVCSRSVSSVKPCLWIYQVPKATVVQFVSSASRSYLLTSFPDSVQSFKALRWIEEGYWKPCHMAQPILLRPGFRNAEVWCLKHVVAFGSKRVAWVNADFMPSTVSAVSQQLRVDVLLVCRGTRLTADELLRIYRPQHVVLDGSLAEWERERWTEDLQGRGVMVHYAAWKLEM